MIPLMLVKQLVKLLLPPVGPLVVIALGIMLAVRRPRAGRFLAFAGVLAMVLLAMPAVGGFLVRSLDRSPPLDLTRPTNARAIVILGGGTRRYAPEYGGAALGTITLERVRYGARVARATGLPVLVSGGAVRGAPPEAVLMRNALANEFGVSVRWMETRSRNTHENAVNAAAILKADDINRVILVGHSFDFPRTRREFAAAGIFAIPAPIDLPVPIPTGFGDFWPSAFGLQQSYFAIYEMLANALFDVMHASVPVRGSHAQ